DGAGRLLPCLWALADALKRKRRPGGGRRRIVSCRGFLGALACCQAFRYRGQAQFFFDGTGVLLKICDLLTQRVQAQPYVAEQLFEMLEMKLEIAGRRKLRCARRPGFRGLSSLRVDRSARKWATLLDRHDDSFLVASHS